MEGEGRGVGHWFYGVRDCAFLVREEEVWGTGCGEDWEFNEEREEE